MANKISSLLIMLLCSSFLFSCGDSGNNAESSSSEQTSNPVAQATDSKSNEESKEPEEYGSGTLVVKTGQIYGDDYDYYPVTLYVDENGSEDIKIDNFAEVDFSLYKPSDSTGSINFDSNTVVYTVTDGVISEGTIDDITSDTMVVVNYYEDDEGDPVADLYVYVQ